MARIVTAEHGKVTADAQGEVQRELELVEFACGLAQLLKGEHSWQVPEASTATRCASRSGSSRDHAVRTSPSWCPGWMFPLALAAGNTSSSSPEQDTCASMMLAELLAEAGVQRALSTWCTATGRPLKRC